MNFQSRTSKVEIREALLPNDVNLIRKLWTEYLTWGNNKMQEIYGVHPHDPKETVELDIKSIEKFQHPQGQLLLAFFDSKACGIGCLKKIDNETGEIKRMYIDPSFRKIGAGKLMLESLLQGARELGYHKVKLDSAKFMESAHALYRKVGFKDISAYDEVEIPEEFRQYLVFMEIELT